MFRSHHLGSLLGFPIRINTSFLLALGFILFFSGGSAGLAVALTVAASIVVHELGHAVVARRLGVPIAGIELHFFGGAAQMAGSPRTPNDEIAIAAAGPAVSFALAGLGLGASVLFGSPALGMFAFINVVLGAFNLLPAFPSDGGRILRALLARRYGLVGATERAVKVARFVCIDLGVLGLAQGSFQLVLLALVLWSMGSAERRAAQRRGDEGAWGGDAPRPLADVEYFPPGAPATSPHAPGARGPAATRSAGPGRNVVFVWRL